MTATLVCCNGVCGESVQHVDKRTRKLIVRDLEKLLERIEKQQFQQQDRTEPYIPLMLLGDSSWYECGEGNAVLPL